MTIASTIESVNIVIGVASNSLLIYLSLRFSKKNLGNYKYLIMIFAAYDLFLTFTHAIVDPKMRNFDTVVALFSAGFPENTWLCPLYVSFFTVPYALTNINFLHRYWAVKKPEYLQLFSKPWFMLVLAAYPIGTFFVAACVTLQTDIDDSHFVHDYYLAHNNESITGWRVMHHWKDDKLNVPQCLVLLGGIFIMVVNFAIAIFLSSQTMSEIRKAKTFTFNFRALQIKILRALFAQFEIRVAVSSFYTLSRRSHGRESVGNEETIAVPVVAVYIPFGCAILFPFFKIKDTFQIAHLCMTMSSFFPAWDAIVVILLIKDYRDGLRSLVCTPTNAISTATTVWKTQTTTDAT